MRLAAILFFALLGSPAASQDCDLLTVEYTRYDSDRTRVEVSGLVDNSALRSENRLTSVLIFLQRQSMILDMIIASGCPLPPPPRLFSRQGALCQGSPQACRE
jgi:hypothetical protein